MTYTGGGLIKGSCRIRQYFSSMPVESQYRVHMYDSYLRTAEEMRLFAEDSAVYGQQVDNCELYKL